MSSMPRIIMIAERAKAKRDPHATLRRLEDEKATALKTGMRILMSGDYEARERWIASYKSLCRRINENRAELEDAA